MDVQRVIESSIRMAWNEIRHRAVLVKELGDVPAVDSNEARLGQILLNLLVNAAQAIPEGRAGRNEIRVVTGNDGEWVRVSVTDTGVGIARDVLPRIFDPFFTTKTVGAGTGLGLSIVQGILENHGGSITVPEVRMSPDLKHATVLVMPLGGKDIKPVLEALERNKRFIRGEVAHAVNMKYAPDLRFYYDETIDRGREMEALLRTIPKPSDDDAK